MARLLAFDRRQARHGSRKELRGNTPRTRVIPGSHQNAAKQADASGHAALLARIERANSGVPATLLMGDLGRLKADNGTGGHGQVAGDPNACHPGA